MLCLSGFELYSRWVPLSNSINKKNEGQQTLIEHDRRAMPLLQHELFYDFLF